MKNEQVTVSLPEQVVKELDLKSGDEVILSVRNQKIMMETANRATGSQTLSLRWFLIPTAIASLLFFGYLLVKDQYQITLIGKLSIANMVLLIGVPSGVFSFILAFVKGKKNKITSKSKDISWRNFPAILMSFIIISLLGALIFFKLLGLVFIGASFDRYTATLLFFIFSAVINYFMIYSAISVTSDRLISILIVVILGGVLFAMFTNRDYQWWQFNFSFLGTIEAKNRWQFNLTLIFSALLMVALIDCLFVDLQRAMPENKRLIILRILLTLTALDLGAVGLFPYTETGPFQGVHNHVAEYLVYLIIVLIVGIKWLLPNISKEFMSISYLIVVMLVTVVVLFMKVGYLSLTAFELFSFVLAFSWIILLLQALQKMAQEINNTYCVKIEDAKRRET